MSNLMCTLKFFNSETVYEIADKAARTDITNINNNLQNNYVKKSDISGIYNYKGSVSSESALPTTGMKNGDVYNIESESSYGSAGMNVAWNGTSWDAFGGINTSSESENYLTVENGCLSVIYEE